MDEGLREAAREVIETHDCIHDEPCAMDELRAALAANPAPAGLDVELVKSAFKRGGLVWVIPASLFDEAAEVFAAEYDALAAEGSGE